MFLDKKKYLSRKELDGLLDYLKKTNFFESFDFEFILFFIKNTRINHNLFLVTLIFLNNLTTKGFLCLDLSVWDKGIINKNSSYPVFFPTKEVWERELIIFKDKFITFVNNKRNPNYYSIETWLVYEKNKLYFQKGYYWENYLLEIFKEKQKERNKLKLEKGFFQLDSIVALLNYEQKIALFNALYYTISIISGGPGTGKTFLIYSILYGLFKNSELDFQTKVAILSPTGKATNKVKESLLKISLKYSPLEFHQLIVRLTHSVSTIHRFISNYKYGGELDILLIDEFSMVSFSLLFQVLKKNKFKKMIFLGDYNQLPSVDEGSLLKDLISQHHHHSLTEGYCSQVNKTLVVLSDSDSLKPEKEKQPYEWRNHIVELKYNYRQAENQTLNDILFGLIRGNKLTQSLEWVKPQFLKTNDFKWYSTFNQNHFQKLLVKEVIPFYKDWFAYVKKENFELNLVKKINSEPFKKLKKMVILSPITQKKFSTNYINEMIEKLLLEENIISLQEYELKLYPGLPILITRNNYELNLFNGDIGFIFRFKKKLQVLIENQLSPIPLEKINYFSPYYSLTIHKSQGSEFENGVIVFPPQEEINKMVFNRELIYTALSRIKKKVFLFFHEENFKKALNHSLIRHSGLTEKIWDNN